MPAGTHLLRGTNFLRSVSFVRSISQPILMDCHRFFEICLVVRRVLGRPYQCLGEFCVSMIFNVIHLLQAYNLIVNMEDFLWWKTTLGTFTHSRNGQLWAIWAIPEAHFEAIIPPLRDLCQPNSYFWGLTFHLMGRIFPNGTFPSGILKSTNQNYNSAIQKRLI